MLAGKELVAALGLADLLVVSCLVYVTKPAPACKRLIAVLGFADLLAVGCLVYSTELTLTCKGLIEALGLTNRKIIRTIVIVIKYRVIVVVI